MKKTMHRTLAAIALVTAFGAASTNALAYPIFTVNENPALIEGAIQNSFSADRIYGTYLEIINFLPTNETGTEGTFSASLKWNAGGFVDPATTNNAKYQLGGATDNQYDLYALYQATGTFITVGQKTTFNFGAGGTLNVFLDQYSNTDLVEPGTGFAPFVASGSTADDDILIATGSTLSGQGNLDRNLSTCPSPGSTTNTSGINCGSFGASSTFTLTDAGRQYFVAPNPFYNTSFQSGQLNNFSPSSVQRINGSMDVVFGNAVPEPATVALLGLGLLGVAAARRKAGKRAGV